MTAFVIMTVPIGRAHIRGLADDVLFHPDAANESTPGHCTCLPPLFRLTQGAKRGLLSGRGGKGDRLEKGGLAAKVRSTSVRFKVGRMGRQKTSGKLYNGPARPQHDPVTIDEDEPARPVSVERLMGKKRGIASNIISENARFVEELDAEGDHTYPKRKHPPYVSIRAI